MDEFTEKEFDLIRAYTKEQLGISLGKEKKSLVYSRLNHLLRNLNMETFSEYYDYLRKDASGMALRNFIDKITTNHTYFMRETEHFDYFTQQVCPWLEEHLSQEKDIRLWCAGCSSGEEAYTLQMLLTDYFGNKEGWKTGILATDISTTVLQKAYNGVYPSESVQTLPESWQKKYFEPQSTGFMVVKESLRNQITFRRMNLMTERFPFKKPLHVIFCRNVMIYFDNPTRDALVSRFYQSSENGGYLFIGHSESLNHANSPYKYIKPAVYQKITGGG